MFFYWINKTPMTETIYDEICKGICIISALFIIGLIGYIVDKLETWYRSKHEQRY